jgi:uncharacterized protein
MEFNGDVYSCDHFVYPGYKLGNISTQTLTGMMYSDTQLKFSTDKYDALPQQCFACPCLTLCYGECPKNRIIRTDSGEPGLNYLCEGYYAFFEHVAPCMDFMANELRNGRPPSNIMQAIRKCYPL